MTNLKNCLNNNSITHSKDGCYNIQNNFKIPYLMWKTASLLLVSISAPPSTEVKMTLKVSVNSGKVSGNICMLKLASLCKSPM